MTAQGGVVTEVDTLAAGDGNSSEVCVSAVEATPAEVETPPAEGPDRDESEKREAKGGSGKQVWKGG